MDAPAASLPNVDAAELGRVSILLNPVIVAVNASTHSHRSGHVAVLCHSLLTRIPPNERGSVLAYLQHMIRSDLN